MILSLILFFVNKKNRSKIPSRDFTRVLSIVIGMAFLMMITVVYGINYIIKVNPFPIQPYVILFIFAIVFVLASVFYEKRGALYPWFLLGGAGSISKFCFYNYSNNRRIKIFIRKKTLQISVLILYSILCRFV